MSTTQTQPTADEILAVMPETYVATAAKAAALILPKGYSAWSTGHMVTLRSGEVIGLPGGATTTAHVASFEYRPAHRVAALTAEQVEEDKPAEWTHLVGGRPDTRHSTLQEAVDEVLA